METQALHILIVEDEPNYADTLEMFVEKLGYNILGIVGHAQEAMLLFQSGKPDLILMDIHIKGEVSGIDLAKKMQAIREVPIIFITSYDDPETFDAAKETLPVAYLVKPFDPDQLERAMALAVHKLLKKNETKGFDAGTEAIGGSGVFFIKERSRLIRIRDTDILWVGVEDKYCMLHIADRKFVLRQSLKELLDRLDMQKFVRTHRSCVVRLDAIEDIDLSEYTLHVNGESLPLGQSYKDELLKRLRTLK